MANAVSPRRQLAFVVLATVLTGASTYVFLAIISRSLDDVGFDSFSVFWSLSLIIGFGLFLPIEQELSRLGRTTTDAATAGRAGVRVSIEIAGVGLAGLGLLTPLLLGLGVSLAVVAVCAGFIVVSAVQFGVRGLLLAADRVTAYSVVLLVDSVLRVLFAAGLALAATTEPAIASASTYALGLMIAILLAHLPMLAGLRGGASSPPVRSTVRTAALTLVAGALAAQVLLNVGPILIDAADTGAGMAGAFQATFSLARIPLFLLVPLQGVLVAPLAGLVASGRTSQMTGLMLRIAGAIAGLAVLGALGGWLVGPWIVELIFGAGRSLAAEQVALLIAAVLVHSGLVISTGALIAAERHRRATLAWVAAVVVFAVTVAALWAALGPVASVGIGFLVGSLVGWALALIELRQVGRAPTAHAST